MASITTILVPLEAIVLLSVLYSCPGIIGAPTAGTLVYQLYDLEPVPRSYIVKCSPITKLIGIVSTVCVEVALLTVRTFGFALFDCRNLSALAMKATLRSASVEMRSLNVIVWIVICLFLSYISKTDLSLNRLNLMVHIRL